jgi:hypothetical protein
MKNKYGNFVIQKAIKTMTFEDKLIIKEELRKKIDLASIKERERIARLIDML